MADAEMGVPARELSDAELERQGVQAHATRHRVFLHGTAEQFRTHTRRMLALEEEYLRRHPQRTWQGSGGADGAPPASAPLEGDAARAAPGSRRTRGPAPFPVATPTPGPLPPPGPATCRKAVTRRADAARWAGQTVVTPRTAAPG